MKNQIALFLSNDREKLQKEVNEWLSENAKKVEVVSVDASISPAHMGGVWVVVTVHYRKTN